MSRLVILTDYSKIDDEFKSEDVIAFTHAAQLACDQQGVKYTVPDKFYDYAVFRKEFLLFAKELNEVLERMDKRSLWTWFPHAYSGNKYWFVVFFANVFYLKNLVARIRSIYSTSRVVILYSGKQLWDESNYYQINDGMDFTHEELNLHRFSFGLDTKVFWLRSFFADCQAVKTFPAYGMSDIFYLYYNKIKHLPARGYIYMDIADSRDLIWAVQGGYEVEKLKKYLPEYRYSFPLHEIEKSKLKKVIRQGVLTKEFREFLLKWFSGFHMALNRIYNVFSAYQTDIVQRLRSCFEIADGMFRAQRPKALFYSVGATRLHEALLGWMANERGVPVFYFDHGGGQMFSEDPLMKYQGANCIVSRHQISRQKFGSIAMYELNKNRSVGDVAGAKNSVLYCAGPPVYHAYKDMLLTCSDSESYEKHNNIIDAVLGVGMKLDIKVHPGEGDSNYFYFRNLCKDKEGVRVLYGFPAEEILGKYNTIVIDFLRSALTEAALIYGVRVICYSSDRSDKFNGQYVSNKYELEKALTNIYISEPEVLQDPGPFIADYIRGLINGIQVG